MQFQKSVKEMAEDLASLRQERGEGSRRPPRQRWWDRLKQKDPGRRADHSPPSSSKRENAPGRPQRMDPYPQRRREYRGKGKGPGKGKVCEEETDQGLPLPHTLSTLATKGTSELDLVSS